MRSCQRKQILIFSDFYPHHIQKRNGSINNAIKIDAHHLLAQHVHWINSNIHIHTKGEQKSHADTLVLYTKNVDWMILNEIHT